MPDKPGQPDRTGRPSGSTNDPIGSAESDSLRAEGPAPVDPVVLRRARLMRWSEAGQRLGYLCFAAAVVLFVIGFVVQFASWLVTTIVGIMVVGSTVLLPAIIVGYAAKAAEKEERGEPFGY